MVLSGSYCACSYSARPGKFKISKEHAGEKLRLAEEYLVILRPHSHLRYIGSVAVFGGRLIPPVFKPEKSQGRGGADVIRNSWIGGGKQIEETNQIGGFKVCSILECEAVVNTLRFDDSSPPVNSLTGIGRPTEVRIVGTVGMGRNPHMVLKEFLNQGLRAFINWLPFYYGTRAKPIFHGPCGA